MGPLTPIIGLRRLALAAGLRHNAEIGQPGLCFSAYGHTFGINHLAVPIPYHHSNLQLEEMIYYVLRQPTVSRETSTARTSTASGGWLLRPESRSRSARNLQLVDSVMSSRHPDVIELVRRAVLIGFAGLAAAGCSGGKSASP